VENVSLHRTVLRQAGFDAGDAWELVPGSFDPTELGSPGGAFSADLAGVRWWCRVNENHVIDGDLRDARVLAGFQLLSRVADVAPRYRQVLDVAAELALYGVGDRSWHPVLPGVREVALPRIDLASEWFLVVDSPAYRSLLVAVEVEDGRFEGVTSHDGAVIEAAVTALDGVGVGSISRRLPSAG